jgi:hypothetical protein
MQRSGLTLLSLTCAVEGSAHRGLQGGLAHGKRLAAQTVPVELKKIVERGVMRHEKGSGGEFWPICMGNRRGQFPSQKIDAQKPS